MFRKSINSIVFVIAACILTSKVWAVTAGDFVSSPAILSTTAKPMVLLALSNDHQLYFKSYSDYDDLDGDGTVETTYTHSIDYVGYFDAYKCYDYNGTNGRFEPKTRTLDKYCTGTSTSGEWSGNFLNWATMTRIDQIRKVLYGGFRRTDTATETVLERSFLVTDAHSFAKYYDGTDLNKLTPYNPATVGAGTQASGMTFCNTTPLTTGESQSIDTANNPPRVRIVNGNYSLWAAGERFQCRFTNEVTAIGGSAGTNGNDPVASGVYAYNSSPATSAKLADLNVRVSVCVSGLEEEDCKKYPTSNHKKPVGLLQDYGDNEEINFGLLTGSYLKNKSGGVLRKNIGSFADEVNTTTDGTFKAAPVTGGIVNTLNHLRLARYNFSDGLYNNLDSCAWGKSSFNNGTCTNWGNPFAEMMLECYRYYSGGSASTAYSATDSTIIPGLTTSTWSDPLSADNACANLSIVSFNASTTSYDADELTGTSGLNTSKTAVMLTDDVGTLEGIDGGEYFVGEVDGGVADQLCNPKTVSTLGKAKGTCPDAPRLGGSYHAAGLAYHVYQTDIRDDLPGDQNVTTYAVSLAPAQALAVINVPSSTRQVTILPACRNLETNPDSNCAIVDFKVLLKPVEAGGKVTAKYYVNWEDSEQGGDFDQDMHGVIDVTVTSTTVTVTTKIIGKSTPNLMGFGYVIAGTTVEGFFAHSGINGYNESVCTSGCKHTDAASSKVFNVGDSSAKLLESPLYYAAKYGSFNDIDGSGTPNSSDEWDIKNTQGEYIPDGLPDSYFPVTNPLQLKAALQQVFSAIGSKITTSSAAAVVANSSTGTGVVYQGIYYPSYEDSTGNVVKWVGLLQGLFRDDDNVLREDSNGNKKLDGYPAGGDESAGDYKIDIFFDEVRQQTRIKRFDSTDGGKTFTLVDEIDFDQVGSLWNARDRLATLTNAQVKGQRVYGNRADSGRYIFTGIDADGDGIVDPGETFDFDSTHFPAAVAGNVNYRYLGLNTSQALTATDIVNYVRGADDIVGYRNRTINFDGAGDKVWRLGDIIHSEPAVVSSPNQRYDITYNDTTYQAFRAQYEGRRNMIYVGGNDGMLHAFNGGFYNSADKSFSTTPVDGSAATDHSLGSELWSYVPMAVLPHLRWLTSPDYEHVYYVDGSPRVYDVNIFAEDDDHPYGWGTILVMGLNFGGGDVPLDLDEDGTADITTHSSYIVMDITNPEKPPKLIAEISTSSGIGYTTAKPVVVKNRVASTSGSYESPAQNQWLLMLGSGPTGPDAITNAVSDKFARLLMYDLVTKSFVSGFRPDTGGDVTTPDNQLTSHPNSYLGNLSTVDWEQAYQNDSVYFGIVGGSPAAPEGALKRLKLNFTNPAASELITLLDVDGPILESPRAVADSSGNHWVYAGTGRYLVSADNTSSEQHHFYGVIDDGSTATVSVSNMVDVTDIQVFTVDPSTYNTANSVRSCALPCSSGGADVIVNGVTVRNWEELRTQILKTRGWYRMLELDEEVTNVGSSRSYGPSNLDGSTLSFIEYAPSVDNCKPVGYSRFNAVHFQTGTASPYAVLGIDSDVSYNSADLAVTFGPVANNVQTLGGDGNGDQDNAEGDNTITDDNADLEKQPLIPSPFPFGRQSWREINIDWNIGL